MPRRKYKHRKPVNPDPVYGSRDIAKFINRMMLRGKKSVAQSIFYDAMNILQQQTQKNPLEVFNQAIENIRPLLEVKSRRVGGSTYQVPMEVAKDRSIALAHRWVIGFARGKGGAPMTQRLATELLDAYNKRGASFKKREDTHRMAEANKAFAHYRW